MFAGSLRRKIVLPHKIVTENQAILNKRSQKSIGKFKLKDIKFDKSIGKTIPSKKAKSVVGVALMA